MNFVAGLTLLVVRKESSAFWIFVALLQTMASYYKGSLAYVREDLDRLAALTRNQIPRLAAHFASLGFTDYSLCFPKWLLCLFVSVLKTPLLLKTLDNFFCYRGNRRDFLLQTCECARSANRRAECSALTHTQASPSCERMSAPS